MLITVNALVISFYCLIIVSLNNKIKTKMRTTKVKAIFKGLNNSCGYKTNNEYTILIRHKTDFYIQIEDVNGGGWCEYGSLISFLENWDNIRIN